VVVTSRTRGLLISADRRAVWTPPVRILVARALTQRYVGGFLWVGDRTIEASGQFSDEHWPRRVNTNLRGSEGVDAFREAKSRCVVPIQ